MKDFFETFTRLAKDWITHVIALAIVGVSLALISRELWNPDQGNLDIAQGIAAIVGPWVGVVIGFYFGERGGARLAEAASEQAQLTTEEASSTVDEANAEIAKLRAEMEGVNEILADAGI